MEAKIRILVSNLEKNLFIKIAHVNPDSFGPLNERYVVNSGLPLIHCKVILYIKHYRIHTISNKKVIDI